MQPPVPEPLDKSLKLLSRTYPTEVVRFLMQGDESFSVSALENVALNIPEKRPDVLFRLEKDGHEFLLHVEFQLHPDTDLPRRVFLYNALITETYGLPVFSVVVYLHKGGYATFPVEYKVGVGSVLENAFRFESVRLWEHRKEIEEGQWTEFAPFLVLCDTIARDETLVRERDLILRVADTKKRADLLSLASLVGSRSFPQQRLEELFKEEMQMIRDGGFIQDWIEEGVKKGHEQGAREAKRSALLDVLWSRFPLVPGALLTMIEKVEDLRVLDGLLKLSLRCQSLDEFGAAVDGALA